MKHRFIILNIIFFFCAFQKTSAWGILGHRITGQIAQFYLTAKAKKAIASLLGDESLAMAGNWADFIKSDSSYTYLNPWHYINVKDSLTNAGLQDYLAKDTATDAYVKIKFLTDRLKNKKQPKDSQRFYLRLLIHIAEDLHQPMHVSREEDQGGNKIQVLWFGEHTNLHSLWDEKLINYQQLSYTEYANAINHTTKQQITDWQHQPISRWIADSYLIAQQLYKEITQSDQKLGYRYNFDHIAILNEQLLKGGVQLAGLLNDIFK